MLLHHLHLKVQVELDQQDRPQVITEDPQWYLQRQELSKLIYCIMVEGFDGSIRIQSILATNILVDSIFLQHPYRRYHQRHHVCECAK